MDNVNHPEHYTSHPSGIECIQITQFYDFCIGNAIKYLWRCGLKHEEGMSNIEKMIEDLKKAVWYINKKIELLENNGKNEVEKAGIQEVRPTSVPSKASNSKTRNKRVSK